MATLQSTVALLFQASSDSKAIDQTIGKLDSLNASLGGLAAPFANLADIILTADAVLLGLGATLGYLAFDQAVAAQNSMTDLKKVAGDLSEGELKDLRAEIEKLGLKLGENANVLTDSTTTFVQFGFSASESLLLVENALKLATAGGIDMSQATDILKSTLLGFSASAEDSAQVIDILNGVSNQYATDVEQLGIAMGAISPIAKLANLSFIETAAVLTPVIEVFGSGSEAANALKTGLLKLVDDSKPVQEALAAIGVAQKDANGQLKPAGDILFEVGEAFKTTDDKSKLFLATQLVGIDQAGKMVQVFDNLDKSLQIIGKETDFAGSAQQELDLRLQTVTAQIKITEEAFRQAAESLGDKFLPATQDAIVGAGDLGKAFIAIADSGALDPLVDILKEQLGELSELFKTIAKNLPEAFDNVDFSGIESAFDGLFGAVGDLFGAFFGEIDITTVDGLSNALQKLADSFEFLLNSTSGIIKAFEPIAEAIGGTIDEFSELDAASAIDFGEFIGSAKAFVDAGGVIAGVLIALSKAGVDFQDTIDIVFGGTKIAVNTLQIAFDALALVGVNVFGGLEAVITNFAISYYKLKGDTEAVEAAQAKLKDTSLLVGAIYGNLKKNTDDLAEGYKQMTLNTDKSSSAHEKADAAGKKITETFANLSKKLEDVGNNAAAAKIEENIANPLFDLQAVLKDVTGGIDEFATGLDKAGDSGATLTNIESAVGKVKKKVDEATGVVTYFTDAASKGTIEWGLNLGQLPGKLSVISTSAKDGLGKTGDLLNKAAAESKEFLLELEKLNTQKFVATVEANTDLAVAKIEADAQILTSAFGSVTAGIQSTGDTVSSLVSTWAGLEDGLDKLKLEQYIEAEFQFRQSQFNAQKQLIDEMSAYLKQKTGLLNTAKLTGLKIEVTAPNLQAISEALLYEVFGNITAKAVGSNAELLVALAAGQTV